MRKRTLRVRITTALAIAMALPAALVPLTAPPANALPAGWFFLQSVMPGGDGKAPELSALSPAGQVSGYAHLERHLKMLRGAVPVAHLWKEQFPATGSIGEIKLRNRLTGQCLAETDNTDRITIRPCTDPTTLWKKVPLAANTYAFQRTWSIPGPWPDWKVCVSTGTGFATVASCKDSFFPHVQWRIVSWRGR
ncbi:hypothetical protein Pth03_09110 [Planotetraspora thailandica]|uniref:Ricin B lectin domain-containing protein n=1 Tax=Planotetraspora thailandica TaxID=487172 RepID=A0A8J3XRX4_9ACTN|nr:hypothetical protein Pth03_09110 [Planotetraspora thailandica]